MSDTTPPLTPDPPSKRPLWTWQAGFLPKWDRKAWQEVGPHGRAAVVLAAVGLAVVMVGIVLWHFAVERVKEDPSGVFYFAGIRNDSTLSTQSVQHLITTVRLIHIGSALALLGLIVALLSWNRETPPPQALVAVVWSGAAFGACLLFQVLRVLAEPVIRW